MSAAPADRASAATGVELFVYYRVTEAQAAAARDAVAALHAALRREDPALDARVLRRPEARDGLQTWMEVYARPGGLSPALGDAIEQRAAVVLAGLIEGPRHVERFSALDAAPG